MYMKTKMSNLNDSSNIMIRLIRKEGETDQDTDDKIVIHHKGEDIYHVFYRDGNFQDESRYQMTVHDGDSLDTYLYSLFRLISTDRDPFKAVQFNIPGFPTLYYTPKDLRCKVIRRKLMNLMPIQRSALTVYTV